MSLRQAWVPNAVVSRPYSNATFGFLDEDSEDKAMIDTCQIRDVLDGVPNLTNLFFSIVRSVLGPKIRAGDTHDAFVCIEPKHQVSRKS